MPGLLKLTFITDEAGLWPLFDHRAIEAMMTRGVKLNDLIGKVFLVTGVTEGIDKAASLEFAKRGATLTTIQATQQENDRSL